MRREPRPQQMASVVRVDLVLVGLTRVEDDGVVQQLHIAGSEVHLHMERGIIRDRLDQIQRRQLILGQTGNPGMTLRVTYVPPDEEETWRALDDAHRLSLTTGSRPVQAQQTDSGQVPASFLVQIDGPSGVVVQIGSVPDLRRFDRSVAGPGPLERPSRTRSRAEQPPFVAVDPRPRTGTDIEPRLGTGIEPRPWRH